MFGRSKKKPRYLFTLEVNAYLQPMHREPLEEPLDEALQEQGLGEVTGGGTMLTPEQELGTCDIEVGLYENTPETRAALLALIDTADYPAGSTLEAPDESKTPFGKAAGLAVRLDGDVLNRDLVDGKDINHLMEEIQAALDEASVGKLASYWQTEKRTSLFYMGSDFAALEKAVAPLVAAHPLGDKSAIEQYA